MRTEIFAAVTQAGASAPVVDIFVTGIGAFAGEALLWLIKSPSAVLAMQKQVAALREEQDAITTAPSLAPLSEQLNLFSEALRAWPVLAIADVPYISLRAAVFVALH